MKIEEDKCQWIEIWKKITNLWILPGKPCRCLDDDDPCCPDQFEKLRESSMSKVLLQEANAPSLLHNKRQPYHI